MREPLHAVVHRGTDTALLALALASLAPLAQAAQFDADAPEPVARIRGSVVLDGGGTSAARERFRVLAGEAPVVVVDTTGASGDAASAAAGAEDATFASLAAFLASDLTDTMGAVWLETDDARTLLADARARERLDAVLARGGVLGLGSTLARAAGAAPLVGLATRDGLGWVPGTVVLTGYERERDEPRLLAALEARPDLVALGLPAGATLVLDERWLTSLGPEPFAYVTAPGSDPDSAAPRVDRVGARRRTDLLTLNRRALASTRAPFPPAAPAPPRLAHGALVLAGGGRLPAEVLERFVALAGGAEARIVVVPCTYEEELRRPPGMLALFRSLGAADVTWIHTKDRAAAGSDEALLAPLREATGIWFGGGRQWNLVDSWQHTEAHRLMHGVLERGGVIGGSSAGASIQADYMCRGNPLGNAEIMWEGYDEGLGFLRGVAVDQHFTQRGRQPDMESLVARYPQLLGIGLDEGTALVVRGSVGEVLGRAGHVHFYDRRRESGPSAPVRIAPGGRFELPSGRVLE